MSDVTSLGSTTMAPTFGQVILVWDLPLDQSHYTEWALIVLTIGENILKVLPFTICTRLLISICVHVVNLQMWMGMAWSSSLKLLSQIAIWHQTWVLCFSSTSTFKLITLAGTLQPFSPSPLLSLNLGNLQPLDDERRITLRILRVLGMVLKKQGAYVSIFLEGSPLLFLTINSL
jgi:hypothetical protein